jgi:hypothetical protein
VYYRTRQYTDRDEDSEKLKSVQFTTPADIAMAADIHLQFIVACISIRVQGSSCHRRAHSTLRLLFTWTGRRPTARRPRRGRRSSSPRCSSGSRGSRGWRCSAAASSGPAPSGTAPRSTRRRRRSPGRTARRGPGTPAAGSGLATARGCPARTTERRGPPCPPPASPARRPETEWFQRSGTEYSVRFCDEQYDIFFRTNNMIISAVNNDHLDSEGLDI